MREEDVVSIIADTIGRFGMDRSHVRPMLEEIVKRSELLIAVASLSYAFRHLSLQEYLAATELARKPGELLARYRAHADRWREAVKLWCGASGADCTEVIGELAKGSPDDRLLAFECVAEAEIGRAPTYSRQEEGRLAI